MREQMGDPAWEDYQRAIHDPATVRAMCEDYRAGLGMDRQHDNADLGAGRRVTCPVLVIWATRDDMERLYGDPTELPSLEKVDFAAALRLAGCGLDADGPETLTFTG